MTSLNKRVIKMFIMTPKQVQPNEKVGQGNVNEATHTESRDRILNKAHV